MGNREGQSGLDDRVDEEVPFEEAVSFTPVASDRFEGTLHESWYQGRGVYGGLVAAILARAVETDPEARPLRAITVSFLAPALAGPAHVRTSVEHEGGSVSTIVARLYAGEVLAATALATLAKPRRGRVALRDRAMPALPPADEVPEGPDALYLPTFCRHLDLRQALGPAAFSGGSEAYAAGWCRMRTPTRPSAALVLALLDAWAPAALGLSPAWCGAASLELSVTLDAPLPAVAHDAHWAFEARASRVADGYADELATLFTADGTAVARAQQLIAIYGDRDPA